jgi:hypothetical protein
MGREASVEAREYIWCTHRASIDGAQGGLPGGVVHGAATLLILLVVDVDANGVGKEELWQWSLVRENGALSGETNVLLVKLYRASLCPGRRHSVLARPQEEENSNGE